MVGSAEHHKVTVMGATVCIDYRASVCRRCTPPAIYVAYLNAERGIIHLDCFICPSHDFPTRNAAVCARYCVLTRARTVEQSERRRPT